jgi:hypothetical protein
MVRKQPVRHRAILSVSSARLSFNERGGNVEDVCFWSICFHRLTGNESKFFGFGEFLTALALMVLAWTTTDARYRFRVRTAPLPMQRITFWIVLGVGTLTLLTDLWRAEKWYVPTGNLLSPGEWQGAMGAALLVGFLTWTWFAFMHPPRYGRLTAERFGQGLYGSLLRGESGELAVIADELLASVAALVRLAPTAAELERFQTNDPKTKLPAVSGYAHDIFQLFADPRFVKALVDSAPHTALELFWQMGDQKRFPAGVHTFARNFVTEAIENKHSFLYRETEAYESGLLGGLKPLTNTMFASYSMVDQLDSLLDAGFGSFMQWDAEQLRAFGRLVVLTMKAYVKDGYVYSHSAILSRAFSTITSMTSDVYKLNGLESIGLDNDSHDRLYRAVQIVLDCIAVLDEAGPPRIKLRHRETDPFHTHTIYDTLAKTIVDLVFHASYVRGPRMTCWSVQHNAVWGRLFHSNHLNGPAGKVVKHKVRRLLYDDTIGDMERFPNYKAAALVGLCLNVLGHRPTRSDYTRDSDALQAPLIRWLKKNFVRLHETHPDVAEHCLLDTMSYDPSLKRIMFARPGRLGQKKLRYSYLQLD